MAGGISRVACLARGRLGDPSKRDLLGRDVQPVPHVDRADRDEERREAACRLWLCSLREAAHGGRFVVEQVKDRGQLRDHEQVVDALGGVQ
jgi:hypothetical protein